jgi:hypothetical protein
MYDRRAATTTIPTRAVNEFFMTAILRLLGVRETGSLPDE